MTPSRSPTMLLRSIPTIAVALAAVLFTMWLAAGQLRPHSLFAASPSASTPG